ncbi:conserved hypothetical protein [Cupriavidus taiwanensis]|uniref:Transposase n=3 Tax=Cupriavidus TaxID=106589 RepID=A0A375DBG4_9BURK|nr:conserved hypothetical protein [Cupriavidus taiwanensis]SOZ40771.1 conserved hypothetical protein [Cupriavidus neocaledonicus]SOY76884.1 conserved hypothetical protein [Cupriavidus taiwanensis]SOY76933.1 conserved hypothetical protein [Cupriavidus taiwanensis]SOY77269.1 conserved hypothetical protein [Cupriavidus taiwanensis]
MVTFERRGAEMLIGPGMAGTEVITVSMRELDRLQIVQAVVDGQLRPGVAAERLGDHGSAIPAAAGALSARRLIRAGFSRRRGRTEPLVNAPRQSPRRRHFGR